jgi:hypothetical protein
MRSMAAPLAAALVLGFTAAPASGLVVVLLVCRRRRA